MSGFFGVASKENCNFDLFFGTDYHSHLGTRRAGMAVYGKNGFIRSIHNIQNTPFRTKFEYEINDMEGNYGIGCISDYEGQPILMRNHHGTFAVSTISKINNAEELVEEVLKNGSHLFEMQGGEINSTELVAALISQKDNLIDGIRYAQERVDGCLSILILSPIGIYAVRDKMGRTPVIIARKENALCACFESHAYGNLGYKFEKELGPGEIVFFNEENCTTIVKPGDKMKICTFLWVYFGYPAATYEGINVEDMRYNCGKYLARRDVDVDADVVAGVPDSGTAHAVGYANESGIPFSRPFIKYTPTWPRSFMPVMQSQRNLIARMKLLPVPELIKGKKLLLIDDSIVRGTQLRETAEYLYNNGAEAVHVRPACPPIMFGCKYLNFSRSTSDMDLIARRVICELEGTEDVPREVLDEYCDPDSERYKKMEEGICKQQGFTSLRYHRLDDLLKSVGIPADKLCTYCWNGKE